jgi:hypothetical protein
LNTAQIDFELLCNREEAVPLLIIQESVHHDPKRAYHSMLHTWHRGAVEETQPAKSQSQFSFGLTTESPCKKG